MRKEKYIKVKNYKGNTYFTVQFTYGPTGNKHTYSKTFNAADYDTPTQALNEACRHRDIKRGELLTVGLPTAKMTVSEAYEKSKEIYKRAESTEANLDGYFGRYFSEFSNTPMADITEFTITSHLESLRNDRSDVVISAVLSLWKRICKTAKGLRAITVNPSDTVEAPRSTKHVEPLKQYFSDEEITAVLDYLMTPVDSPKITYDHYIMAVMVKVARYTGLRPREIKYLHRDDVDFETETIYVRPHGKNIKTRSSIRPIPMNSVVKSELLALFTVSPYELPFMFYGGIVPDPAALAMAFNKAGEQAGVKGFHLYGMRHVFDSELITNGVDPRTVMELMGHTSVNTTLAVYARSTEEKRKEAIRKVENGRKPS